METTITATNSMAQFKTGVDDLLSKRSYFIQKILPQLVEGRDYYIIKGRKSLGKAGAEKLASIYSLVATFIRDTDTLDSLHVEGLVAYICTLTRNSEVVGQGRGAAELKMHGGDSNKTIKMAQKSAFVDACIRCTGLSDIFTSDLEDMNPSTIQEEKLVKSSVKTYDNIFPKDMKQAEDEPCTAKQKDLVTSLIYQRINSKSEQERWLKELETASKFDASEIISSFLMASK